MSESSNKRSLAIAFPELPDDASSAKVTWRDSLHSDWKLVLGSKSFPVHKVVVGVGQRRILFLSAAFRMPYGQADETELTQLLPRACETVLEAVLDYMYGDEIELTADTWACVVKVADVMQITSLLKFSIQACDKLIESAPLKICVSAASCCLKDDVQSQLLQMASDSLATKFTSWLTELQGELVALVCSQEHGWTTELLYNVLSRDDLKGSSEDDVFDFLQKISSQATREVAAKLWAACRVPQLSHKKLLAAAQESGISKEALALTAIYRQGMLPEVEDARSHLRPRPSYSQQTSPGTRVSSIRFNIRHPCAYEFGKAIMSEWRPFSRRL